MDEPKGIIITSPAPRSGKTVIASGIAGAILESGLQIEAVKPFDYGLSNNDIKYMVQITRRINDYEPMLLDNWYKSNSRQWNQLISTLRNFPYPVLLEIPDSLSTPLKYDEDIYDSVDLSKKLNWQILLVVSATERFYEQAAQAICYLKYRNADILGMVVTCNKSNIDYKRTEEVVQHLVINFGITCHGIMPYSPSISVDDLRQGNVIKLTQQYIDLLPIQTSLNLTVVY